METKNGFYWDWWYVGDMPDGRSYCFDSKEEYEKAYDEAIKKRKGG